MYSGQRAIVTGGLGFIGSNLAIRLVELGAQVTIIDAALPGCGANYHNIAPVGDRIHLIDADIGKPHLFRSELAHADVIFNLAGEISHVHSMSFPERDLQINTVAQLRFLLGCRDSGTKARIVYAGTRQVYGIPRYLPVDEAHPVNPIDFNGVHKYAATSYHLMLARSGHLDTAVLRLTNVYGPRIALDAVCQGFFSTFVRRMTLGETIEIFGDGKQLRDPLFVDDAVEAFLLVGNTRSLRARSLNVGGPQAHSVSEIAKMAAQLADCPEPVLRPFPPERKRIDIGSYYTDNRRIRNEIGWQPRVSLEDGLSRTLAYYRSEMRHYLDPEHPNPPCRMPEHGGAPGRLEYVPGVLEDV